MLKQIFANSSISACKRSLSMLLRWKQRVTVFANGAMTGYHEFEHETVLHVHFEIHAECGSRLFTAKSNCMGEAFYFETRVVVERFRDDRARRLGRPSFSMTAARLVATIR